MENKTESWEQIKARQDAENAAMREPPSAGHLDAAASDLKAQEAEGSRQLNSGSWIAEIGARIYDKFVKQPKIAQAYAEFVAKEQEELRLKEQFQSLSGQLDQRRDELAILSARLSMYLGCDPVQTVISNIRGGYEKLDLTLDQLARALVVKSCGTEILSKAAGEVAALEKELKNFVSENKSTLKALGLI
jgi:hypothetical protein